MSGRRASAMVIPSSTESMAWSFSLRSSRAARGTKAVGWSSSSWEVAEAAEAEAEAAEAEEEAAGAGSAPAATAVAVIIMEESRIPWSSASRAATRARSREASSASRG